MMWAWKIVELLSNKKRIYLQFSYMQFDGHRRESPSEGIPHGALVEIFHLKNEFFIPKGDFRGIQDFKISSQSPLSSPSDGITTWL